MKKIIILLFCLLSLLAQAQDLRNIFVGRYAGTMKQTVMPQGNVFYDYNSLAEIVYGDSSIQRVFFSDSCSWSPWSDATGAQIAYADSTLREWGNANIHYGKLYANDSLSFIWSDQLGSNTVIQQFFGFKLYSTVGIKEIILSENQLLLSPQPANDILYTKNIQCVFDEQKPPALYDLNGRKVELGFHYINANTFQTDVSTVGAGVYVLVVETEKGILRKKVIVQH